MTRNSDLRYRRQFIASFKELNKFYHWQHVEFKEECFHIYAHPDLELTTLKDINKNIKLSLLGFAIDPCNPHMDNQNIIKNIVDNGGGTIESLSNAISSLSGRFIIILSLENKIYVIHDPCGLRTVYYATCNGDIYIASQPLLFSEVFDLKCTDHFQTFHESKYKSETIEHFLPSGITLYKNVHHLIPNHFLDVTRLKQIRYWPNQQITDRDVESAVHTSAEMLVDLLTSVKLRFKLALPLTSGFDSRVLLAASKNIINDVYVYTLMYRDATIESPDLAIPHLISKKNKIKHHIFDCRYPIDPEFYKLYKSNVDMAHDDWAKIAFGMFDKIPHDRVNLKGNCSEIARCGYYASGTHDEITSPNQLASLEEGWDSIPFIVDYLGEWLKSTLQTCDDANMDILDLFYWEHRMGSWQAQGQLEWDIVHETFTPFNHRPLLVTMLGTPAIYRKGYFDSYRENILYKKLIFNLWPELLHWPVNRNINRKDQIYYILKRIGIYEKTRNVYYFLRNVPNK